MPENVDAAARYRAALEEYLHDEREFAPSCCLDKALGAEDLAIDDLARAHADALAAALPHIRPGALSAMFLRSAMALATAVMARSIWWPQPGEFDSRSAYSALERYLEYARVTTSPFSILVIDIDNFRGYNGTHGRKAGDEALLVIHGLLCSALREGDVAIRCGGDEFCVILPGASLRGGMMAADRIRSSVEDCRFGAGRLAVSVGLVGYPADGSCADRLMQLAYESCHVAFMLGGNGIYTPLIVQPEWGAADPTQSEDHGESCHADPSAPAEQPEPLTEDQG